LPRSDPRIGDVYYYPYIWARQGDDSLAEKDRPCCVVLRLPVKLDGVDVFLLAISTTGFPGDGDGLLIPPEEIARIAGLDATTAHWLTTSEFNETAHETKVFRDSEYRGTFSVTFMKDKVRPKVLAALEMAVARKRANL
jgi:hypothetical protein